MTNGNASTQKRRSSTNYRPKQVVSTQSQFQPNASRHIFYSSSSDEEERNSMRPQQYKKSQQQANGHSQNKYFQNRHINSPKSKNKGRKRKLCMTTHINTQQERQSLGDKGVSQPNDRKIDDDNLICLEDND
jgi:hypothetical protein